MGYNLRRIRREKDMTQNDLASASGVSRATICNIEKGKAKTILSTTLLQIAAALGVTVDELIE